MGAEPKDRGRRGRAIVLTLLALALLVLHQDFWNWEQYQPLWLGFLPIGLTYHAAFAVACAVLMWLLVRFLWPRHLETLEGPSGQEGGH